MVGAKVYCNIGDDDDYGGDDDVDDDEVDVEDEEEDDGIEEKDVEEKNRSQDREALFVRACAVEMHMDRSQEPSCGNLQGKCHTPATPRLNTGP